MHEVELRESSIGGVGVFAVESIRADEFIREFEIEREVTSESPLRPDLGELPEHCPVISGRMFLVARPDRYLNHSCDPNAYLRYDPGRTDLIARRDIEPGAELTLDYLINNPGGDSWPCHCGASRCRGETGHSFFTLPENQQREYLPLLAPWFRNAHAEKIAHLHSAEP